MGADDYPDLYKDTETKTGYSQVTGHGELCTQQYIISHVLYCLFITSVLMTFILSLFCNEEKIE